jgi:hypothetical protein
VQAKLGSQASGNKAPGSAAGGLQGLAGAFGGVGGSNGEDNSEMGQKVGNLSRSIDSLRRWVSTVCVRVRLCV